MSGTYNSDWCTPSGWDKSNSRISDNRVILHVTSHPFFPFFFSFSLFFFFLFSVCMFVVSFFSFLTLVLCVYCQCRALMSVILIKNTKRVGNWTLHIIYQYKAHIASTSIAEKQELRPTDTTCSAGRSVYITLTPPLKLSQNLSSSDGATQTMRTEQIMINRNAS